MSAMSCSKWSVCILISAPAGTLIRLHQLKDRLDEGIDDDEDYDDVVFDTDPGSSEDEKH